MSFWVSICLMPLYDFTMEHLPKSTLFPFDFTVRPISLSASTCLSLNTFMLILSGTRNLLSFFFLIFEWSVTLTFSSGD